MFETFLCLVGMLCLALIPTSKCQSEVVAIDFGNVRSYSGTLVRVETGSGTAATTNSSGGGGGFRVFGGERFYADGGTFLRANGANGSLALSSNNVQLIGSGNLRVGGGVGTGTNGTNALASIRATNVESFRGSSATFARDSSGRRLKIVL